MSWGIFILETSIGVSEETSVGMIIVVPSRIELPVFGQANLWAFRCDTSQHVRSMLL